ncbi:kinase [Novosphingobium sp. PC22D]|uniref:kinase n=1 Tax=Novosphingobium sp. PC22D TaxID=1962403 RepID=UPI000BEF6CD0|nr:kinase [Novosphingobium sp. PC22D]PEQ11139.1 kinase [Novosphingobium sp. PC22D]
MSGPSDELVTATTRLALAALEEKGSGPAIVGICGTQASGKSTLVRAVGERLAARGVRQAVLSIDDIYLTRAERERLAAEVHPLLVTRGPPGTHDVALGQAIFDALVNGEAVPIPRFDKGADDRRPEAEWSLSPADCEVVLFEGWCVGATPQDEAELAEPVNALEVERDPDGTWRRFANQALAGSYQDLFARLDKLVLLAAPGFEIVFDWRLEQERHGDGGGRMNAERVAEFIAHYERITRHILAEMPDRADMLVRLDARRRATIVRAG